MRDFIKENSLTIILSLLSIIGLLLFCGHYSGILIDFGREVYYPEQILQGKVLYKDLFNIYGPLSYQINAILYFIFGAKLSTLYGMGCICSVLTVIGTYLIANKFFSNFLSFCIGIFTITVGICTTSLFNLHFPYSWAVVYGLICFLYSLYFLLKYNNDKKDLNLIISSLLCGTAISCKYDFIVYAFVVLFFIIKSKNIKALLSFLAVPIVSFGILFIQGLRINDLINSLIITKTMAKSKTLTYFYQNSGIYFHPKALLSDVLIFITTIIPFGGMLLGVHKKKLWITVLSCIAFVYLIQPKTLFGFLPIAILICGIISFKKIDSNLKILTISTLAVCTKVFWVLLIGSYGNYYVSIAIIALLGILFTYIPKNLEKPTGIYILLISILLLLPSLQELDKLNFSIKTEKGTIYTNSNLSLSSNMMVNYIKDFVKPTDKMVIFPEGMTINFLTNRKSDDFYNSLLPLYVEAFGENELINHYKENSPEYIVLTNLNMKDYYFNYICNDYALEFCGFINENYKLNKVIDEDFKYIIFKKK